MEPMAVLFVDGSTFRRFLKGKLRMKGERVNETFSSEPTRTMSHGIAYSVEFVTINDRDEVSVIIPMAYWEKVDG